MNQSHSQPSDALRFIHELRRAINDNSKEAAEVLEQDAQLWGKLRRFLELIPAPADQQAPPCKEVDIPTPTEQERLREELEHHLKHTFDNSTPDQKKQLREALENFLTLFETPKQPPPDKLEAAKLLPSDSIIPIIPNDAHDLKVDQSGCAAGMIVPPPLQPALPRWSVLSPPMVAPIPMNGGNKSALVIEYNKSLSGMFTAFLKSDHYLVRTAYQSEEALRLYRDCGPFEVVVIGYRMPKKNGIDIALDILKQDATQPMIIVAPDYRSEDEVPRREELMSVPFLLDMRNARFRKALDKLQPWAKRAKVDRAITALTNAELLKLRKYAEWRVYPFRGTDDRTWEDLLQEAKRLTVEGRRRWNRRVKFFTHLIGVMRSITRRRKGDNALLACDTFKDDVEGQEICVFEDIAASERNEFFGYASREYDMSADQSLIEEETVRGYFELFKDDPIAQSVLQGLSNDLRNL